MTHALSLPAAELEDFVSSIFEALRVPPADARRTAECLVNADLRGISSHGVGRIPIYARRLREGLVNPTPTLPVERALTVGARIDGENGLGFVVGTKAMQVAIDIAKEHGVGFVVAHRSTHYGMAASYLMQAVQAGLAAFAFTNASPAMPIWGGRTPFLGTSPFAFAAPTPDGQAPVMLDMAMSVVARGKIRRAVQHGQDIPIGWALDKDGRPTTDAKAGYEGVVLPMGGVKGSGLSFMMEILAGVLSGSAFGGEVRNQYFDFEKPQNVGHCFLAIKPDLFMPMDGYLERMRSLIERAKACEKAEGVEEILIPGEPEARQFQKNREAGVILGSRDLAELVAEAETAGAEVPDRFRQAVAQ